MYRTININDPTFQQLNTIAAKLNKPKAQVVETLVKDYGNRIKGKEKKELEQFNSRMEKKIRALRLSKKVIVDTTKLDKSFFVLNVSDF